MNKVELRKHFREIRANVSFIEREKSSRAAAFILSKQALFVSSQRIACYMAFKDEFDVQPIIAAIWAAGKECYLPVLLQQEGKSQLRFAKYGPDDVLHTNRFGIAEPDLDAHSVLINELDMVITPLIAFDRHGNRLGTGGGYYDQTFKDPGREKPVLVGAAYAVQEAQTLPVDPWDVKLDAIITDVDFMVF